MATEAWPAENASLKCSLAFASCYVYAPRGDGLLSSGARLLCQRVKACDPLWLPRYTGCVAELCARQPSFEQLFGRDAWLVPVPRSGSPGTQVWPAWELSQAFHGLGLARGVWPGLMRILPVARSASALLGQRPTVWQHYESFCVAGRPLPSPRRMVLVDDVITKGRTLFAAAARLRHEYPHLDIRAFALVRTLGFLSRLDRLLAPAEGIVYWAGGDARREP